MFSVFLSFADLVSLGVFPERQNTRRATGKRDNFGNESLRAVKKQLPEIGRWRDILPKQECSRLPHISHLSFIALFMNDGKYGWPDKRQVVMPGNENILQDFRESFLTMASDKAGS